jgi:predicted nucleotide-binding protein
MARKSTPKVIEQPPSLPPDQAAKLLRTQYDKGKKLLESRPIAQANENAWKTATRAALQEAFGSASMNVQTFANIGSLDGFIDSDNEPQWETNRANRIDERLKLVEGLIELLETKANITASSVGKAPVEQDFGHQVFLVHGHDEAILHLTARFLETLDLEVIVLREQPNQGRTIIEKFIDYSNVGFAVVLLTGDDRGGVTSAGFDQQQLRARQNVILELGYFLGKLGRKRVCALHQPGIEIPSDYSGVLFVAIDDGGGWKLALAREMKSVGYAIDMNKAI